MDSRSIRHCSLNLVLGKCPEKEIDGKEKYILCAVRFSFFFSILSNLFSSPISSAFTSIIFFVLVRKLYCKKFMVKMGFSTKRCIRFAVITEFINCFLLSFLFWLMQWKGNMGFVLFMKGCKTVKVTTYWVCIFVNPYKRKFFQKLHFFKNSVIKCIFNLWNWSMERLYFLIQTFTFFKQL